MQQTIDDLARTPLSRVFMVVAALTVVRILLYRVLTKTEPHKRTGGYRFFRFINEISDALVYAGIVVFMIIRPFALQTFLIPTGSMWPTLGVRDFIVANKAIYRYSEPQLNDIVVFRPPKEAVHKEEIDTDGQVKIDYIKRLVGRPGDVVELREGVLYRNGEKVDDPHRTYSECTLEAGGTCAEFRKLSSTEEAAITKASFKLVKRGDEIIPFNWTDLDANSASPNVKNWSETTVPYSVAPKFQISDSKEAEELKAQKPQAIPPGYYLMMGDNRNGSFDSRGWGLVPRDDIVGRSELIWLPLSRIGITR